MSDPKQKPQNDSQDCDEKSIECAEKKLHESVSKDHPEWVDENGDCPSCTSLEHELAADPSKHPEDQAKKALD